MATKKINLMMYDNGYLASNFPQVNGGNNYRGNALATSQLGQANSSLRKRYDDTYACTSVFAALWGGSYPSLSTGHLQGGQASNQKMSEFQNSDLSANNLAGGEFVDKAVTYVGSGTPIPLSSANVAGCAGSGTWTNISNTVDDNDASFGFVEVAGGTPCWVYDLGANTNIWKVGIVNNFASFAITHLWLQTQIDGGSGWQSQGYWGGTYPAPSATENAHALPYPGAYRYVKCNNLDGPAAYVVINEVRIYPQNPVYSNQSNLQMG